MRSQFRLVPVAWTFAVLLGLGSAVILSPAIVAAESENPAPAAVEQPAPPSMRQRPIVRRRDVRPVLDEKDEIAALEAVQLALSEVGDGAAYVWHARNGHISGTVQPTQSFKQPGGRICRHVIVSMSSGAYSRQTEGVACRLPTGVWQLEG